MQTPDQLDLPYLTMDDHDFGVDPFPHFDAARAKHPWLANSKYGLVIYAAKRARQINAYYGQLAEGLLEHVGPLVETGPQEKPLSIALREINDGLLTAESTDS